MQAVQTPKQRGEKAAKVPPKQAAETRTFPVAHVALTLIDQGDQLIRHEQDDDDIAELAADLSINGLLQPIGVHPKADGRYQLLYGARRTLAATRLGWQTIPAHIHADAPASVVGIAARENLLRRALTLSEECDAVARMHHDEGLSPGQIASLTGKGRGWVLRRLAVPQLPDDLRNALLTEQIALGVAETLCQLEDPGLRAYALQQARSAGLSVADVRGMVQAILAAPNMAEAIDAGTQAAAAAQQAQSLAMACGACGEYKPLADLTVIRVCATPCTQTEKA